MPDRGKERRSKPPKETGNICRTSSKINQINHSLGLGERQVPLEGAAPKSVAGARWLGEGLGCTDSAPNVKRLI